MLQSFPVGEEDVPADLKLDRGPGCSCKVLCAIDCRAAMAQLLLHALETAISPPKVRAMLILLKFAITGNAHSKGHRRMSHFGLWLGIRCCGINKAWSQTVSDEDEKGY